MHGHNKQIRLFHHQSYPELADRGLESVLRSFELTELGVARIELGHVGVLP